MSGIGRPFYARPRTSRRLRELLAGNELLLVPGAADALTARLIEESAYPACYFTGAGFANTQFALPNKFFEYMAAGLALVSADLVEMRLLTERYRAGVLYESTNVDQLSDTLNELIANPDRLDGFRRNAYHAARDELHWEREEVKLQDYVRRIFH